MSKLQASQRELTVGDIAELANVKPSAVSNWRNRHFDFPKPVDLTPAGALFDRAEVEQWLAGRGRRISNATYSLRARAFGLLDDLRTTLPIEDSRLLLMQMLLLHLRTGGMTDSFTGGADLGARWSNAVARATTEKTETRDQFERALTLNPRVSSDDCQRVSSWLSQEDRTHDEWSALATQLIEDQSREATKLGGYSTTGTMLRALVLSLLSPLQGVLYDPACGSATVLAEAWRQGRGRGLKVIGQEIAQREWQVGYLHLAISGADFNLALGDTLRSDLFPNLRADRIILDPPLGYHGKPSFPQADERFRFPVRRKLEWLWAQHLVHHLSENGTGLLTVLASSLEGGGTDTEAVTGLLESDVIDAVVTLGPGMVAGSGASTALVVFQRNRQRRHNQVLFIDASKLGKPSRGGQRVFTDKDLARVANTLHSWRSGSAVNESGFAAVATRADIAGQGDTLAIRHYVRYADDVVLPTQDDVAAELARAKRKAERASARARASYSDVSDAILKLSPNAEGSWPLTRLGDILKESPIAGSRFDEPTESEAVPYFPASAVRRSAPRLSALPHQRTVRTEKQRTATRNDVLLIGRGITAEANVRASVVDVSQDVAFAESLIRLRPDVNKILPEFLRLQLIAPPGRRSLVSATTGSVIANLRPAALAEVQIRVPDLNVQASIVEIANLLETSVQQLSDDSLMMERQLEWFREAVTSGVLAASELSRHQEVT